MNDPPFPKSAKPIVAKCAVGRPFEREPLCGQRSNKGMPKYVLFKGESTQKRLGIKYTITLQFRNNYVLCLFQYFAFINISAEAVKR